MLEQMKTYTTTWPCAPSLHVATALTSWERDSQGSVALKKMFSLQYSYQHILFREEYAAKKSK